VRRIKEDFLEKLEYEISLKDQVVLEIGCGEGTRTIAIAERCKSLTAIDPDAKCIKLAQTQNARPNVIYQRGIAQDLLFDKREFDIVIFTLSLHHVPVEEMKAAIDEAIRVVRRDGYIIFLEPSFDGTLFESEIFFDAFDGDERKQKAAAYLTMLDHPGLKEIAEFTDETVWVLDSVQDFVESMSPKRNLIMLKPFLEDNKYILRATRRVNIFQLKS